MGDKYNPAMKIKTQADANRYFEACVEHNMRVTGNDRKKAEEIERQHIGYWTGYYSHYIRDRVFGLFKTEHPIFGRTNPTPNEAFGRGQDFGKKLRK